MDKYRIGNELSLKQREVVVKTHMNWPKNLTPVKLLKLLDEFAKEIIKIEKEETK